jgi:Ca2+/Na+ antiporter
VHGYWSIDLGILFATATNQLPGFVAQLRAVREALGKEDDDKSTDRSTAVGRVIGSQAVLVLGAIQYSIQ